MKRMFNRLYQWMWHISVRRDNLYTHKRGKVCEYRYPSPGSVFVEKTPVDYKTPFQETDYNVRYAQPTGSQTQRRISSVRVPGGAIDPIKKLVLLKFLNQADKNNETLVNEAKTKFKAAYGFDVQNEVYKNQLYYPGVPKDRQTLRNFYQKQLIGDAFVRQLDQPTAEQQENQTQKPDVIQFESLDMYDAPHFQQIQVQNHYNLDRISDLRAENGILTKQGSTNFWKALDDSNDPHNIAKVQSKVGDQQPNNYGIKNARVKFDFDKDGNVIDIHRIKQSKPEQIH